MAITLKKLAELTDSKLKGNGAIEIQGAATIQDAEAGQISFLSNPKYKKYLADTQAAALVLDPAIAQNYAGNAVINANPYLTFAKIVSALYQSEQPTGSIHPSAIISSQSQIDPGATIGANVVIEDGVKIAKGVQIKPGCYIGKNTRIKEDCLLYPNVTVYADTIIGARGIIHSGAVIGADGFGFAPQADNSWYKILQVGNVELGDDVEIGANTTIDRAALGSTTIANGVKLDNQIQIGHNVQIGEHTVIAAKTAVAGSTKIGKRVQIGGAVGIAGHVTIADDVIITGMSMVTKSIPKAGVYSSGIPAEENKKWRRNISRYRQLEGMAKTIKDLEKIITEKKNED